MIVKSLELSEYDHDQFIRELDMAVEQLQKFKAARLTEAVDIPQYEYKIALLSNIANQLKA